MTVYVDVLLFLNTVVDFLILSVAASLTHSTLKLWRKTVAALISALFSLYIFLPPQGFLIELLMRLLSSVTAVLIGFGFGRMRLFLRHLFAFYAVSFIYAGLMAGIEMFINPTQMSMNNGIVYFDISPLVLITLSFVFYLIIVAVKKLTGKESPRADRCVITLSFGKTDVERRAMVDTGHTLTDAFGNSVMIIIDRETSVEMFGEEDTLAMLSANIPNDKETALRFRLIPVTTVSGERLLPAVKINRAKLVCDKKTYILNKPTAILSKGNLGDDYSVIIPPDAMN